MLYFMCAFLNTVIISVRTNCRLTSACNVYRNGQVHRAVCVYRKTGVDRAIAKQVTKGRSVSHTNRLRHCASLLLFIVSFSLCHFTVSFLLSLCFIFIVTMLRLCLGCHISILPSLLCHLVAMFHCHFPSPCSICRTWCVG